MAEVFCSIEKMESSAFDDILLEIKEKCPYLLGVLKCGLGSEGTIHRQVCSCRMVTMYAIFLHARNNKASACHADNVHNPCN